jgi:hypothetical protein
VLGTVNGVARLLLLGIALILTLGLVHFCILKSGNNSFQFFLGTGAPHSKNNFLSIFTAIYDLLMQDKSNAYKNDNEA